MRLHTDHHTYATLTDALTLAIALGKVAPHVHLATFDEHGSRKRARSFEIRLGTYTKIKGDKRTCWNTGTSGADSAAGIYSGTYDEWGWFLKEVFATDPDAVTDRYDGREHFNEVTGHAYVHALQVAS